VSREVREIVLPREAYVVLGLVALGVALYWLRGVLTPILLALAIAYVLDPLVDRIEALRVPRGLGVAIVMLGALVAFALFLLLVVPSIVADVAVVLDELPEHAARWLSGLQARLQRWGIQVPRSTTEWALRLRQHAEGIASSLAAPIGTAVGWVVGGTASAIGALVGALIVPVLAIYLLYDFDNIIAGAREFVPLRWRETVVSYARDIDHVLGQFIRGQLIVMAILAVLYGTAYTLLGVRLAIPIGIVAGALNFVPYLGSAFALVAGLLMSALGGGSLGQMLGVVAAYAAIQTLEGFVITPRVVGKTVGLRDVWVLLAMFVGGELFGFLGVLLALPVAAVAKIFVLRGVDRYRSTTLFRGEPRLPSLAPERPPDEDSSA
jgi:predicted PurR-regulated permease PerM